MEKYFDLINLDESYFDYPRISPTIAEHNDRYLLQNFYNLQEKHYAKQKDFDSETYQKLLEFMKQRGFVIQYE